MDLQTIRFTVAGYRLQYLTGPKLAQYVVDFDAGDDIKPFKFTLRDPRVTRQRHRRVDPSAPKAAYGSAEHRAKSAKRHPPETANLVGADGKAAKKVEVMSSRRAAPTSGKGLRRVYGARYLRINRDRFAAEASS